MVSRPSVLQSVLRWSPSPDPTRQAGPRLEEARMSDQDLIFRGIVMALFIGARYVRWHARHLIGWRVSQPAMAKHRLDTSLLIALSISWLVAVVVYVAAPQVVAQFALPLPDAVRWCGVAAALAGLALLYYSDRCLGENLSVTLRIRENHTLVTTGPYRSCGIRSTPRRYCMRLPWV